MEKWWRHGLRVSSAICKHELQTQLAQQRLDLLLLCHMGTRLDDYQSFNKPPQFLFFQCSQELHSLDAGDVANTWTPCHRRDNSSNLQPDMCCSVGTKTLEVAEPVAAGQHCHHLMLLHAACQHTGPETSSSWWHLEEAAAPYLVSLAAASPAASETGCAS